MTSRTARRLAWSIAILCFAITATSLVFLYLDRAAIGSVGVGIVNGLVAAVTLGALGALVASRRPTNAIGWMLLSLATVVGVLTLANHVAIHALLAGVSPHGWVRWTAWVQKWIGPLVLGLLILVLLLFPDGRPLNRRWRRVAWISVVVSVGFVAATSLDPTPVQLSPHLPDLGNPVGVRALSGFYNSPAFLVLLLFFVLGLVALLLRLRRSAGEERQQLKWFAFAVGVSVAALVIAIPLGAVSQALSNAALGAAFTFGFFIAVPGAAALAILRYGLYEIDVVINKTVVYGLLAAFITVVYAGVVVGVGTAVGSRGNVLLSAAAAAIVAITFQPVRERSRRFANRLIYGKRATPYEVLSEFAERMAMTFSVDDVLPRTARILAEATGAVRADVWLRVGSELHVGGSWPSATTGDRIPLTDTDTPEVPGASRVVGVHQQGELLGALSVKKAPGDPVTPAEDKLLVDVASQAGLVLRNVRLIEDLRASRQRLVAAQDEERRKLERNIHDGAQQQLVALAVKTRLADSLVGRNEAKAHEVLAQVQTEAQEALENLRELARGIYPPLLADQGLAVALQAQARRASLPVTVEADGITRYGEDAEAAVYFCCLEALQNVAKYAKASHAVVRLSQADGVLSFEVADDGQGFDSGRTSYGTGLQGIADRLAALGGTLEVRSVSGAGTALLGTVPVHMTETAAG
jgi:signal transduction histidine kinase